MAQAVFSIRMDESLKRQFDYLCQEFGMNTSTAINIFARAVVRERKIPFEISSPETEVTREGAMNALYSLREQAKRNGISNMSLSEINKEISAARAERKKSRSTLCRKEISHLIRCYFRNSIILLHQ